MSLYFNDGRGEFSAETTQEVVGAQSLVPIDLDGDGLLDLATADWELKTVSFLLNRAGGNFSAPVHLALAEMPRLVLSGDLDEDGDGDLIAAALT